MVVSATEETKMEKRKGIVIPNRIIREVLTEKGTVEQKRFGNTKQNTHVIIRGKSIPDRANGNYKNPEVGAGNRGRARRSHDDGSCHWA